jgi:hypothetical protein
MALDSAQIPAEHAPTVSMESELALQGIDIQYALTMLREPFSNVFSERYLTSTSVTSHTPCWVCEPDGAEATATTPTRPTASIRIKYCFFYMLLNRKGLFVNSRNKQSFLRQPSTSHLHRRNRRDVRSEDTLIVSVTIGRLCSCANCAPYDYHG